MTSHPTYILPTHFRVSYEVNEAIAKIKEFIDNYEVPVPYEINYNKGIFKIAYFHKTWFNGEINIYKNRTEDTLVIECNRLSGDAFEFHKLYKKLRNYFDPVNYPLSDQIFNFEPKPLPDDLIIPLTESEAEKAIIPIINMTKLDSYNRQNAADVICDMTRQEELFVYIKKFNLIETIFDLSTNNFDHITKTFAMHSLLNLSRHSEFVNEILKEENTYNLINIMKQVNKGSYETAPYRRAAAEIVYCLMYKNPSNFINIVGTNNIEKYLDKSIDMDDNIIKGLLRDTKYIL